LYNNTKVNQGGKRFIGSKTERKIESYVESEKERKRYAEKRERDAERQKQGLRERKMI
jgi:hypothetical protein